MYICNVNVFDGSKILIYFIEFIYLIRIILCDCTIIETPDDPNRKKHEEELLKRITPLNGLQFSASDEDGTTKYTYQVRICDKVQNASEGVGAVQFYNNDGHNKNVSLGLYTMADIMGGTDWLMLTYYNGTLHSSEHCDATGRITRIMIICDPDNDHGKFRILEEKLRSNSRFCFYLFEIGSKFACTKRSEPEEHGLSSGGVFCVLFFTFVSTYFILGFLYQRLVAGAKGLEQIPHYSFWRAFGNLQADGCDYICRCGPRHESQAYRGIDDRLKEDERDDQLLNM